MKRYATTPVPRGPEQVDTTPKITERQRSFLLDLIERKDLTGVDQGKLDTVVKCLRISEDPEEYGMSRAKASELIDWFLKRPNVNQPAVATQRLEHGAKSDEMPDVPAGRYAVENEHNVLRFYTLDRPTEGKWAGYVFLSVWASDERHPIKSKEARVTILNKILEVGVQACAERFGREIGACAICGRTLTDETSRAIGIGPICRGRTGWYE